MKRILFILTLLIICRNEINATVWRVNNNASGAYGENMGGTATFPVYTQLSEVNTANIVQHGDTIHLEGSNTIYQPATITKRLVIIGPGFFLADNANSSANGMSATTSWISFDSTNISTSEGSQLIGVFINSFSGINIKVNNITVKRCRISHSVNFFSNTSDIFILQNFFPEDGNANSSLSAFNGFPSNLYINNNIFRKAVILPDNSAATVTECKNNVFTGQTATPAVKMYVNQFRNNIITNQNSTVLINGISGPQNNSNISHNVSALANTQFGTDNNNIQANMASLFVNLTAPGDAGYKLQAASAGSSNGSDGTDRGAYGGNQPYMVSGLPAIPLIYEINTTGVAGPSGLPVNIKARTIN